jgi:DNA-binding transcriptional ArsR family regulator
METNAAIRALNALAQETRLNAFRLLVKAGRDGLPAGRIAEELGVALPTLSFHLKELVNAGLVTSQSVSRFVIYRAGFQQMGELVAYLNENCCRGSAPDCATPAGTAACGPCETTPERTPT